MSRFRLALVTTCIGLGIGVAAPVHADVTQSFRKSYTGSTGTSDRFGGGYSLEYGYSISKSGSSASASGDAKAGTWVKLFGRTFDAVSIKAAGNGTVRTTNPTCAAQMSYETFLVGIKIPTMSKTIADGGRWANKRVFNNFQELIPGGNIDFPLVSVAGVTVGVRARAFATEYVNVNGSIGFAGVSAEIRPGANVSAQGTFYLNLVRVLESGVNGTVTFMDIAVPASLTAGWSYSTQPDFINGGTFCAWQKNSAANVNVDITPIAGSLDAFVQIGLPCIDLLITRVCLNKRLTWNLWSTSAGRTRFPLEGTAAAPGIGDSTTVCPPASPLPPTR